MDKEYPKRWIVARCAGLIFIVYFITTTAFLLFTTTVPGLRQMLRDKTLIRSAAVFTALNTIFLVCVTLIIDHLVRKETVDKPLKEILEITEKVTKGDFSVQISDFRGGELSLIAGNLNSMIKELGSMETLREDFIANVSHEIKTPVAIIRNYSQLLSMGGLDSKETEEAIKAIGKASSRLTRLVTEILRLNKLENQQIFAKKEEFELNENVSEALLGYEEIWEEKDIHLEIDMDDIIIRSDKALLLIVWDNLISNALKFTSEGGTVSISVKDTGTGAMVQVSDTGTGFDSSTAKHIFDKFYQGPTERKSEGNGLGLATVRRILSILDAEIEVESTPGMGSVFSVLLPYDKEEGK